MDDEATGTLLLVGSGIMLGLQPIAGALGVRTLHPIFLAAAAATLVVILILPRIIRHGDLKILFSRKYGPRLFLIGLTSTVFTTILLFAGAQLSSGINTALLIQVEPVYATLFGYVFLREQVSRSQLQWTLVLLLGAVIVAYNGASTVRVGDLLILVAPLGWSVGTLYAKRMEAVEPGTLVAGRYLYAAIVLLVLVAALGIDQVHLLWNGPVAFAVIATGAVYAAGLVLFYRGLKLVNMSKATTVLDPVMAASGVILAWPILGETPTLYQFAGGALIIVGVYGMRSVKSLHRS